MKKQQAIIVTPKQFQFPWWKQLTLTTALLLSGGPFAVMASTQAAYASPINPHPHTHNQPEKQDQTIEQNLVNIVINCTPGNGGNGGKSTGKSTGAVGGRGGDCVVTIPIKVLLSLKNDVMHANAMVNAGNVIHASTVLHP